VAIDPPLGLRSRRWLPVRPYYSRRGTPTRDPVVEALEGLVSIRVGGSG
jgi:hypothetical protein